MDLQAYAQIKDLECIAKRNNIEVPRLRGYRLMSEEQPVNIFKSDKKKIAVRCAIHLCESSPFWSTHPEYYEASIRTDYMKKYYLVSDKSEWYADVRWDRIHGWKRKVLKTCIHNEFQRQYKQLVVWNKYAGRKDILYIHARIGGGNWPDYYKEVVNQPWFLEKVDDSFDSTYCDIYARINN